MKTCAVVAFFVVPLLGVLFYFIFLGGGGRLLNAVLIIGKCTAQKNWLPFIAK